MSFNSWKVSVWCCTSHRGILERYFWRRWQVSIIKRIRSVWHFGRTFALFTDNCKDIPQCFTLKSIWDSPVWPLSQYTKLHCLRLTKHTAYKYELQQCVENSFFYFFCNMRGHRKCISLEKHGPLAWILNKLDFISFEQGWIKCHFIRNLQNDAVINTYI